MDEVLPYRILNILRDLYIEDPTGYVTIDYFEPALELPENEIHGALIYLKEKDWIKSFKDGHGEWVQRINAKGMDELNNYEKIHLDDDTPLEFDVSHEDHSGKIKVFISHKFVKSDQKLARSLENYLANHNIYGYLAERRKEYDVVFGDKIKNEIRTSDYLVAIITKNSHFAPSVHQEIGYAMGFGVPVRIMAEEQEAKGVLVEGKDIEIFTRQNFEKSLGNIIVNIQRNGIRKKLTEKEKDELKENIYRPCYNKMYDVRRNSEFIDTIPDNPWIHLEPYLKIKVESDIEELFEEYEKERQIWHTMWIDFGNKVHGKRKELGEILRPIFATYVNIDQNGRMEFAGSMMEPSDWLLEFKNVLLNTKISSVEELEKTLKEHAVKNWGKKHSEHYDKWHKKSSSIYSDLLKIIPTLVKTIGADFTYQEIDSQRRILKIKIELLTDALEEKLK